MSNVIRAGSTGLTQRSLTPIATAVGFNTTPSYAVFQNRNGWSHVPGKLQCTLRPDRIGNKVHLEAKIVWGGAQGANESGGYDMAVGFRFFKRVNGAGWYSCGNFTHDAYPGTSTQTQVGCGTYRYNWDANSSNATSWGDWLQYTDTVEDLAVHEYAVFWTCLYDGGSSRTILWNRTHNMGNSYNPVTTCCIVATEIST